MNILIQNTAKAEQFAMLFQHVKTMCEHINLTFDDKRMYVQCMDGSHVSIMELTLPAAWFDRYTHTHDTHIVIGLSSAMLFKILNSRDKSQQLVIDLESADADTLHIHFTGENKKEFDKHFELPLISLESEPMEIPPIEYNAELSLSAPHFASIIGQLQMFGDTMEIECSESRIGLASRSSDQGKMMVEIKIDDLTSFVIDEGSELQLSFGLQYLHNICLYKMLTKEVELKFSQDYPMQVVYKLAEDAMLSFFLAPKIVNDE